MVLWLSQEDHPDAFCPVTPKEPLSSGMEGGGPGMAPGTSMSVSSLLSLLVLELVLGFAASVEPDGSALPVGEEGAVLPGFFAEFPPEAVPEGAVSVVEEI